MQIYLFGDYKIKTGPPANETKSISYEVCRDDGT